MEMSQMQSEKSSLLPVLITIVLTAVVVGGGVYYWQQDDSTESSQPTVTETPKEEVKNETTSQKGFFEYFENYEDFAVANANNPTGLEELHEINVENCPPEPDGVCGYALTIMGPRSWNKGSETTFYFMTTAGGPGSYFGPFKGDLDLVLKEAKKIKSLTAAVDQY